MTNLLNMNIKANTVSVKHKKKRFQYKYRMLAKVLLIIKIFKLILVTI